MLLELYCSMFLKQKSCDPKAIEEKVISMARNALKPHYHNGAITSEEFKLIMKKAIAKVSVGAFVDFNVQCINKKLCRFAYFIFCDLKIFLIVFKLL